MPNVNVKSSDTEYIASWLLQKATECGFKRKLKSDRQTSVSSSSVSSSVSTVRDAKRVSSYFLETYKFEPMAEVISANASKIQFPARVEAIFDRVITSRRDVNKEHTSLPTEKRNLRKDKTHEYFIAVIEKAYEKLKPYVTIKSRRTKKGATAPKAPRPEGVAMENSFSGLTVKDTSESVDAGATDPVEDTEDDLPEVPPVQVERDEDEIEDEFHFQTLLLINELHPILQVVLRLWASYRDGKVDVVVPSLATNIAIDLVRQAEADFEELIVRPKKYLVSTYPVWTLLAVAYHCQSADFGKNPIEELVKPDMIRHDQTSPYTPA